MKKKVAKPSRKERIETADAGICEMRRQLYLIQNLCVEAGDLFSWGIATSALAVLRNLTISEMRRRPK